ncbi:MAG: hypothetical protein WCI17_02560 [bacterium]
MHVIVLWVVALIGVPLLFGFLLRLRLRRARPDVLALLASAMFLFLLDQVPVAAAIGMRGTVTHMFSDPFNTFPAWLVAVLFFCVVLARIAVPYLIAHRGIWLADQYALRHK